MFDHYQHFHYDHYVYHHHYHLYPYHQHNNHHSSYCCYYYHHQIYHQYDHHYHQYHHYLEHYLKNLLEHCHFVNKAVFRLTFGKLLTIKVQQQVNNLDFPKLLKMGLLQLNTPDTRLCSYLWQQSRRCKETNNFQNQYTYDTENFECPWSHPQIRSTSCQNECLPRCKKSTSSIDLVQQHL